MAAFTSLMHASFFTGQMDAMRHFYVDQLGGTVKVLTRAKLYADAPSGHYHEIAQTDPERIIILYVELAPGQFIELFPAELERTTPRLKNGEPGYSHIGIVTEDIEATRTELEGRGIVFDTPISKGPSETYKMWLHDPDGNRIEIMQYTDKSFQVVGSIM